VKTPGPVAPEYSGAGARQGLKKAAAWGLDRGEGLSQHAAGRPRPGASPPPLNLDVSMFCQWHVSCAQDPRTEPATLPHVLAVAGDPGSPTTCPPCTPLSSACPSRGINSTPALNANQRRHPRLVSRHDGQGKEEREEGAVELARLQRAPQARRPRQADHNARGHRPACPLTFPPAARDLQPRRSIQLRGAARTALRTPGCSPAAGPPTHCPLPRRRSRHSPRGWSGAARRSARCSCPSLSQIPFSTGFGTRRVRLVRGLGRDVSV
jgi:hypothetical protein